MDDLNRAITISEQGVAATPSDHPTRTSHLETWANGLGRRFERTGSTRDFEEAIILNEEAVAVTTAPPFDRIDAARSAAYLLIIARDFSRAKPFLQAAVEMLPFVSPRSLKHVDRQKNIAPYDGITARAVAVALGCGETPYNAFQLLEVGRGVLANLQLELRSDIMILQATHPEVARKFEHIRDQLDQPFHGAETTGDYSIANTSDRRMLSNQFDDIINTIRQLEGFERFLMGPSETQLQNLAESGSIAVFNVADFRSDVFLIDRQGIRSLRLDSLNHSDLEVYAKRFLDAVHKAGAKDYAHARSELDATLKWLWDVAVGPILNELGFTRTLSDNETWPRLWWVGCGLLNLLPIHAAGYHDERPPRSAIDRVISSYTPTVKFLSYSRERHDRVDASLIQRAVLIGMPKTPGHADLPFVREEIRELEKTISSHNIDTTIIQDPTKAEVLLALQNHQIVHLSCHGYSSPMDPSQSRLLLNDWEKSPLTVSDIIALNVQLPQLAYLSACHTASIRDSRLLDQSIHLSSAIQLSGYPSVVGTLWQVSDRHSSAITQDVYNHMLEGTDRLNTQRSAEGLHRAVRRLRDKTRRVSDFTRTAPSNPLLWAAYIHLGV